MPKLRKFLYGLLILVLIVGFVGCDDDDDDNGGVTTPTGITIYWSNQSAYTVDFYLDGVMVQRVASGGIATTTGVSAGTHMLYGCVQDYKPPQAGCEGEQVSLSADFTYTMY